MAYPNHTAKLQDANARLHDLGTRLGIQEINMQSGSSPSVDDLLRNELLIVEYLACLTGQLEAMTQHMARLGESK